MLERLPAAGHSLRMMGETGSFFTARALVMTSIPEFSARSDVRPAGTEIDAACEAAGADAFRQFCTPSLSSRRAADHDRLVERARFHLRNARRRRLATSAGEIAVYEVEPEGVPLASVLLVHGWTGEAAFMGALADLLRRRGMRCVLVDLPAHGCSHGTQTTLMDCARVVLEVAEATGPMRFALGHSVGAMAALLAGEGRPPMPRGYPFEAYVLVAMPDRFADVTRDFGEELGLSPAAHRDFERRLERLAGRRLAHFTGANLLASVDRPALLLHARDDTEVPFENACSIAAALPTVRLEAVDGLGHRAILYAPPALRAAAAFLGGRIEVG
jgi:alpha-beta hydrolase superfamily lysophospholipase